MSDLCIAELQASHPAWSARRGGLARLDRPQRHLPASRRDPAGLAETIEQGEMPIGDQLEVQQAIQCRYTTSWPWRPPRATSGSEDCFPVASSSGRRRSETQAPPAGA
jgi:hypothetical protein